jgi:hypothetical protein
MDKRKVAIIGLGAAGAFAARAAYDMRCDVDIYVSGVTFTPPPGAFWMHWVPEDVTSQATPASIYIQGVGSATQYTKRQWGKPFPSSFPATPVWETGYNPAEVLPLLVPAVCEEIHLPYPLSDADVLDISRKYDMVFQTFASKQSRAEQPPLRSFIAAAQFGIAPTDLHWVMYNGTPKGLVVREAQLFGNKFLEFPKDVGLAEIEAQHDLTGYQSVMLKDLDPTTKPWQSDPKSKVKFVGRMAMWDRKFLSHDSYKYVQTVLQGSQ